MKPKLITGVGLAVLICLGSTAWGQDAASKKFLQKAIEGNMAEIQMGQLAQQKGKSDEVRSFGQTLEKDHSDSNQKALEAASSMGVTPPSGPNSEQKAQYNRLSKLSGEKFDAELAKHMVLDHKKDIKEYERAAKKNDNAGTYAKDALPTLHKHLDMAQSLSGGSAMGRR